MTPQRSKQKLLKPHKTSEKILQKALQLFLSKGYEATSTNDICWAAKITKPTLYYYFPTKRHVLHAVHLQNIKNVLQPHLEKCAAIKDPIDRLLTIVRDYASMVCSHPELRFLLHETLNIKDEEANEIKREWKRHYLLLRDTIETLQTHGKIRSEIKPSGTALLILGMISWITYWFDPKRRNTIDDTVDLVLNMALFALGMQAQIAVAGSKKVRSRAKK